MSKIRQIRQKQERIARHIEGEKRETPKPLSTPLGGSGGVRSNTVGSVLRAKCGTINSPANGQLQARLLNSFGTAWGVYHDVYAFPDQDANDITDYLPTLTASDICMVTRQLDGNYYLAWPTLIQYSDCS